MRPVRLATTHRPGSAGLASVPSDQALTLLEELERDVEGEIRFDPGARALYATDGSNYRHVPIGVVIPRTVDDVVDQYIHRFLRVPLAPKDRQVLVDFLRTKLGTSDVRPGDKLENSLRELLYLVLSTPEYQLG